MNEKMVTIDQVGAAFETLLEVVGRECDTETTRTVHFARVDVLAILSGEWVGGETAAPEPDDEPAALRCPACDQSLGDIKRTWFACPTCYETFTDDEIEAAMRPY